MKYRPITLWNGTEEKAVEIDITDIKGIELDRARFVKFTMADDTVREFKKNDYMYPHWTCFIDQIMNRFEI